MTRFDLFCLVADKNMEAAVSTLLDRPQSIGMRPVTHRMGRHPERDPGCFHTGADFLKPFRSQARHALIILDYAWDGVPAATGVDLEGALESRLAQAGMEKWAKAVVIDPELEAWVFARSPHVSRILGAGGSTADLRRDLEVQGLWASGEPKPQDPKAAMEWVLRQTRQPRSSSIYRRLATEVGTASCTDRAFVRFSDLLRKWFPPEVPKAAVMARK